MPKMRWPAGRDRPVTIQRRSTVYKAAPGQVIDVKDRDVDVLARIGFELDPAGQTKAQIREQLEAAGVDVPSNATKDELVAMLNEHGG